MTVHLDELHQAIKRGSVRAVREYVAAGGALNTTDKAGWSPVAMAASAGNSEILALLLDAGADINEGWPSRHTPLMIAAIAGSRPAVDLLLARGAKTDAEGLPADELLRNLGHLHHPKILDVIQRARLAGPGGGHAG
jgi:ankyrin repeat protein